MRVWVSNSWHLDPRTLYIHKWSHNLNIPKSIIGDYIFAIDDGDIFVIIYWGDDICKCLLINFNCEKCIFSDININFYLIK